MALKNLTNLARETLKYGTRRYTTKDFIGHYYDPPYLESLKPKYPIYEVINVQIKGYDFALIESYQSVVHTIASTMDLDVSDCWAHPASKTKVTRFKPRSTVIDAEYNLTLYERNVQISELPAMKIGTFTELIQAALPQGVTVTLKEHTDEIEDDRYVPDYELEELQTQLDDMKTKKN